MYLFGVFHTKWSVSQAHVVLILGGGLSVHLRSTVRTPDVCLCVVHTCAHPHTASVYNKINNKAYGHLQRKNNRLPDWICTSEWQNDYCQCTQCTYVCDSASVISCVFLRARSIADDIDDFQPISSGSVVFQDGETQKAVNLTIIDDIDPEVDESIFLMLTNAVLLSEPRPGDSALC